jgi:hypothetical protein
MIGNYEVNQTNPIPITDTSQTPLNIPIQPRRQPLHRRKPRPDVSNGNPMSAPLWRHPRWTYFLAALDEKIRKIDPDFRPHFLELLKNISSI